MAVKHTRSRKLENNRIIQKQHLGYLEELTITCPIIKPTPFSHHQNDGN